MIYFFIPAENEQDAVSALEPRFEGHWRRSVDEEIKLHWPLSNPNWAGREKFLEVLNFVESKAERIGYRGFSVCRLCKQRNGSRAFRLVR